VSTIDSCGNGAGRWRAPRRVRRRVGVAGLLLGALLTSTGCSAGVPGPPRTPATNSADPVSAVLAGCTTDLQRWQPVAAGNVAAAKSGAGPMTVVFLNDSGNSVCGWLSLAEALVARRLQVVVFAYQSTAADDEPPAVLDALAVADDARKESRYVLVGASLGGRIVIEAAATHPPGLAGIVSLSGERSVEDYRDILPAARKVTSPALYIAAREDFYTKGERQQRQLHEAMRGRPNVLLQRDGSAHGTALLDPNGPDGRVVQRRVLNFIDQQLDP
jgi:pimeloyl-ACP methyl ester carboxylesterase